jgi:hypothetical protein
MSTRFVSRLTCVNQLVFGEGSKYDPRTQGVSSIWVIFDLVLLAFPQKSHTTYMKTMVDSNELVIK